MTRLEGPKETLARRWPHVLKTLEEGRIYVVTVKKWFKPRTLNQNSLFHALIGLYCRETGSDAELVKEGIKEQYGEHITIKIGQNVMTVPKPSSQCNTYEMSRLIDGIMLECAEAGIDTTEHMLLRAELEAP